MQLQTSSIYDEMLDPLKKLNRQELKSYGKEDVILYGDGGGWNLC